MIRTPSGGLRIPTLSNPAAAADIRNGKQVIGADGSIITGAMPEIVQATPSIQVSASGLITASASQEQAGYMPISTKNKTTQLSSSMDPDFVAANIKNGVNIFGIDGACPSTSTPFFLPSVNYIAVVTAEGSKSDYGYLLDCDLILTLASTLVSPVFNSAIIIGGYFPINSSGDTNGSYCFGYTQANTIIRASNVGYARVMEMEDGTINVAIFAGLAAGLNFVFGPAVGLAIGCKYLQP